MSKKVLAIGTSLRVNSNSDSLLDAFVKGSIESGKETERITLKGKTIAFCKGCLACQKIGRCVINDDAIEIAEKMKNADVIAFATPIYYYEMCGQMKTLLDRANSLYSSDYKFRETYMLSTAAEDEDGVDKRAVNGLCGWIDCFEKAELKGTVFAGGADNPGDVNAHPSLKKAYEFGFNA